MFSFTAPGINSGARRPTKKQKRSRRKQVKGGNFAYHDACYFSCACDTSVAGGGVDADERTDHHGRRPVHEPDPADAFGSVYAECLLGDARSGHDRQEKSCSCCPETTGGESELDFSW